MASQQDKCVGLVHHVGPIKLLNSGACNFKFVVQTSTGWVRAACLNKALFPVLKEAESKHQVLNFGKPIGAKFLSLYRHSKVTLSKTHAITWKECPVLPECTQASILDVYTGKWTDGTAVEIVARLQKVLQSDFNGSREIAKYEFVDDVGFEIVVKKWVPDKTLEVDTKYKLAGSETKSFLW